MMVWSWGKKIGKVIFGSGNAGIIPCTLRSVEVFAFVSNVGKYQYTAIKTISNYFSSGLQGEI